MSIQLGNSETLRLPEVVSLELARSLLEFLNAFGHRPSYRLLLDEDGMVLERA